MQKILTLEFDQQKELIELHLNKKGAEFLRSVITELIDNDTVSDHHFMSSDWGGNELNSDQQNLSDGMKLIHHLKILYWKD